MLKVFTAVLVPGRRALRLAVHFLLQAAEGAAARPPEAPPLTPPSFHPGSALQSGRRDSERFLREPVRKDWAWVSQACCWCTPPRLCAGEGGR